MPFPERASPSHVDRRLPAGPRPNPPAANPFDREVPIPCPMRSIVWRVSPRRVALPALPRCCCSASPPPPANPIDGQIAELQKRLAITEQQKPQFDAFTQVVRQNAQTMDTLVQQEQKAPHNAVEDLRSST